MRTKYKAFLLVEPLEARVALSTYYVSSNGDDCLDGSETSPWRTLQRAANAVRAGDTVIVRPGTYVGFDLRGTNGTADDHIGFRALDGVIINQSNARTPDGINLEGTSYVDIEGFQLVGLPRAGIRSVLNHHVALRNNYADSNGRWGIFTGFSDDLLIENNVTTRSQAEHGIYVSNSAHRPVVRGNTVWGNRGNGIHMNGDVSQGGDGLVSQALVEQNIIHDNGRGGGSGINCDGCQDSVIQNNLLYKNHASGISLYKTDGADGSKRNLIVNNTVVQAPDGRWALTVQNGSTDNTVSNNILYNYHSFRGSIDISANSLPGFLSDYNSVMNRFTINGGSVITLAQWQNATAQDFHSIVAVPDELFVDFANDDYHLSPNSPAIDAGTDQRAPFVDLEGNPRPAGNAWDIGAYEYQGTASPTLPGLSPGVERNNLNTVSFFSTTQLVGIHSFTQAVPLLTATGNRAGREMPKTSTPETRRLAGDVASPLSSRDGAHWINQGRAETDEFWVATKDTHRSQQTKKLVVCEIPRKGATQEPSIVPEWCGMFHLS